MYRIFLIFILILPQFAFAAFYPAPKPGNDIIGEPKVINLKPGQTLFDLARENEVGLYEILEANPTLNPNKLKKGMEIVIPSQYILPEGARDNIVVNIAELRLYYFPQGEDFVFTVPVGIGRRSWETPTGEAKITDKRENPSWTPPVAVRRAMAEEGIYVPDVMPPGPDNPLGKHAMRISMVGYVIHGTNRPDGVGRRVSAGCIRMSPAGIKELFDMVDIGTPVHLVNEPFKIGRKNGNLFFEAHKLLHEQKMQYGNNFLPLVKEAFSLVDMEDSFSYYWPQVKPIAYEQKGIPQQLIG